MTNDEKDALVMANLYIPPTVHKNRMALFFMIWKPQSMGKKATTPFDASDGFRLVDMFATEGEAKQFAERSRLDYYPGCAIIIDTETKITLRADNFGGSHPFAWVDGLSR